MTSPPAPTAFGEYFLFDQVSAGLRVELHRARWSEQPGDPLALKRLTPQAVRNPQVMEGMFQMSRLAGSLDHPGLVRVLDHGLVLDDLGSGMLKTPYVVRDWVRGVSLAQVMAQAPQGRGLLDLGTLVYIALEVADTLGYAQHAPGPAGTQLDLAHGNLNPRNVFITPQGQILVTDLGLAAAMDTGKPPRDHRADVTALAAMLWELVLAQATNLTLAGQPRSLESPVALAGGVRAGGELQAVLRRALGDEDQRDLTEPDALADALDGLGIIGDIGDHQDKLARYVNTVFHDELRREEEELAEQHRAFMVSLGARQPETSGAHPVLSPEEIAHLLPSPEEPRPRRWPWRLAAALVLAAALSVAAVWWALPPPYMEDARKALAQDQYQEALMLLGRAAAHGGDVDMAEVDRLRAEALLGRALLRLDNDLDGALMDLASAEALAPDWAPVYMQEGRVLTRLGRPGLALAAYRRSLELDPSQAVAWFNTGHILLEAGRCDEALKAFQRVLSLDTPYAADAYVNMAVCQTRLGLKDKAENSLRLALAKNPNHELALKYLAALKDKKAQP